jgi:hypothetical protein
VTEFFKFPHTPHLAWLGRGEPRGDKVLTAGEVQSLLGGDVVVEEKLDGANLGFSLASDGNLRLQNRGQYLDGRYVGQFVRLPAWLALHGDALRSVLTPTTILFGEWCAARHSLEYSLLPDWLILFDVYDRAVGNFWSTPRRDALAYAAGLAVVPQLARGRKINLDILKDMVITTPSHYRRGPMEGVVVRRESVDWCCARAKLIRADFTQAIGAHWRKRAIEWNQVDSFSISGR